MMPLPDIGHDPPRCKRIMPNFCESTSLLLWKRTDKVYTKYQVPYVGHYNPLLIRHRSWILTIHKANILRKKPLAKTQVIMALVHYYLSMEANNRLIIICYKTVKKSKFKFDCLMRHIFAANRRLPWNPDIWCGL